MMDLLFSEVNLGLTIISFVFIAYWLFSMLLGLDFDIDFDIDADFDVDIDADIDSDVHVEGAELDIADAANVEADAKQVAGNRRKPLKWWQVFLIHFNFVGVPFLFTLTCFIFTLWTITLFGTKYTGTQDATIGFLWIPCSILPSLYITKLITTPFKSFFNMFNRKGNAPIEFVGKMGVMLDSVRDKRIARAEVIHDGSPLIINVKSLNQEKIDRKEKILVIKPNKDKTIYFVQAYKPSI